MPRIYTNLIPAAFLVGVLAGCSTMPEWTKPSTWVDGVTETAKTEEKSEKPAEATPAAKPVAAATAETDPVIDPLAPEATEARIKPSDAPTEFPNINKQPEPRQILTTESQRREIRDSLVADRDNAQHSADELKGGTAPAAPPPAPAATPKPATQSQEEEKKPDGSE